MADGREYRIDHPDFVLAASTDVPQITIEERDGSQHSLSALLVASVGLLRMIGDIRQLLSARPFEPFQIITTRGNRYRVASAEHAGMDPQRSRVVIWFDDGSSVTVSGLHIGSIEKDAKQTA